ncbi:hypothetical protein HQ487_04055, partial [Candidatus Uhrbacteria bacterium]|nr:hypothetical protein [Candidatus Uhrbacteria bacterium]
MLPGTEVGSGLTISWGATVLVLDFDGTLTDAEQEGVTFTQGCYESLARLTGWEIGRVVARAAEIETVILADPGSHAWMMDGVAVAPATVDPYLRIKPIATTILEESGADMAQGVVMALYDENYPKSGVCFRDGTLELLLELYRHEEDVYIVTNSATKPVQNKIQSLGMSITDRYGHECGGAFTAWWMTRIYGGAKKYVPGFMPGSTPTLSIPGLNRPVHFHRPNYGSVLDRLLAGKDWKDCTFVGDVFELDLALPFMMESRVGLLANDRTPPYEIAFLSGQPNARVLTQVSQILSFY